MSIRKGDRVVSRAGQRGTVAFTDRRNDEVSVVWDDRSVNPSGRYPVHIFAPCSQRVIRAGDRVRVFPALTSRATMRARVVAVQSSGLLMVEPVPLVEPVSLPDPYEGLIVSPDLCNLVPEPEPEPILFDPTPHLTT